jgi:hypothetical protein
VSARGAVLLVVALLMSLTAAARAEVAASRAKLWLVPIATTVAKGDSFRMFVFIQNTGTTSFRVPSDFTSRLIHSVQLPDGSTPESASAVTGDFAGTEADTVVLPPGGIFGAIKEYRDTATPGRWRIRENFLPPRSELKDMIQGVHRSPWIAYRVREP